jgi:hypothetical protein
MKNKFNELMKQASQLNHTNPFTCQHGNRCGHDPKKPRIDANYETNSDKRRPLILQRIQEKIVECYKTRIQALDFANDSERAQRSERREACLSLLSAFILFLDIGTLTVALPTGAGIPLCVFALLAGLNLRRAQRACADLVSAAILKVHEIKTQIEDDVYRSSAAIRIINADFFEIIGLGKWMKYERVRAQERKRKREKKEHLQDAQAAAARMSIFLQSEEVKAKINSKGEVTYTVEKKKLTRSASIDRNQKIAKRMKELTDAGYSTSEAIKKLQQEFPNPP